MPPHKLDLYRLAVQHPVAEITFFLRAWEHYFGRHTRPTRLREDFAGAAALATTWVAMHENHRALAVESDYRTLRWAQRRGERELGPRAADLHLLLADVMAIDRPAAPLVDLTAALNFSTFIYHERARLRAYFRLARRCLAQPGLLIIDAFGGPGAMGASIQRRRIRPDVGENIPPFDYLWEQKSYAAVTGRIDCRIHFQFPGGRVRRHAFRYDWRLWTLPELLELLHEAGFTQAQVWGAPEDAPSGTSCRPFQPIAHLRGRHDWVAYIIGVR